MYQTRVVTVQDISCFGKCSLTVALPIISAMGIETAIIPTAVLSTHTGGFTGYTFRDLTEDIPKIRNHWKSIDLKFDAIYTGYLGSMEQIGMVEDRFDDFGEGAIKFVDPVMGDGGKLYTGFTQQFADRMAKLCGKADIIVPNLTEACYMLGLPFEAGVKSEEYYKDILKKLTGLGCPVAALTGVTTDPEHQGVMVYDSRADKFCSYFRENLDVKFHGTGDVFSSAMCGALALGRSLEDSIRIAVDYTVACIAGSMGDTEHPYGVRFEEHLSSLYESLNK